MTCKNNRMLQNNDKYQEQLEYELNNIMITYDLTVDEMLSTLTAYANALNKPNRKDM